MKTYEYVSVSYHGMLFPAVSEHREIIDEYAANGYRYVDSIVTEFDNSGRPSKLDLIFEKDDQARE